LCYHVHMYTKSDHVVLTCQETAQCLLSRAHHDQWHLVYFRVQRSSPLFPFLGGLALRPLPPSLLVGSHPPPPISFFVGFKRLSNLCPARRDDTSSFDASRRCMKLQNPPRLHSPFSFCRQQASLKSVTGESSAYNGRPAYQRSFKLSTAVCASVSHSYRAYTLPIRWSPTLSHTCNSSKCPNLANSQYRSSYTASKPSCNSCSDSLQTGS